MSYPRIDDDDFYKRISKKYNRYSIPDKKEPFRQICFPKEFKLQKPQEFLAEYIGPSTPYKGVLVFHRIGAGKTCTGVSIGEAWKHKRRIIVVVPASLKGNFRNELRSLCAGDSYLTDKERKLLRSLHPSSDEYKDIINESNKRINKYYDIYSYNKFIELAELKKLNLRNSVLIIDEIQNMVSEDGKYYRILYKLIHKSPDSLRVVLLSATPMFDKPIEVALTMNLLRIPFEFPTGSEFERQFIKKTKNSRTGEITMEAKNLDIFKERIKGYVSYFRGAPPYVFPETTVKYVKCQMSEFQYKSYLTVLQKEEDGTDDRKIKRRRKGFDDGDINSLPNNFFIGTRIISNIAFPNKDINEDGYESLTNYNMSNIQKYSTKIHKIISKINRSPGPTFIYSGFKEYGGLKTVTKVLESQGYKDYRDYGEGRRRFGIFSGDEKGEVKEELKAVFNQPSNYNGSKLKVMLLSPAGKEGISLLRCRQAHIMEPYWNNSRIEQIIGRAVRYCSHRDLPADMRNVKVYIYIASHPNEKQTIDQYIMEMATKKNKLIQEFEMAVKEAAVDCKLFHSSNTIGGPDIQCDI